MPRSIVRRLIDASAGVGSALGRMIRRVNDRPFEIRRLDASADSLWPPIPEEHPAHWSVPTRLG